MSRAVVFGKFWPLHSGHLRLIEEAFKVADDVLICVCEGTDVPAVTRVGWVLEEFPAAQVVICPDFCGHDVINCTLECSQTYAEWLLDNYGEVDYVVSGDDYGYDLAEYAGAAWRKLERDDRAGRTIRGDMDNWWWDISPAARAYYVKRIVIVGAESSGTTTLAQDLAYELNTAWVREYGRQYAEEHWDEDDKWSPQRFTYIALRQAVMEDDKARHANKYLVCDTDVLATNIWQERYLGYRSAEIATMANNRRPYLYVLTGDEIPFVQDGIRDGEDLRPWMTEQFRKELGRIGVPWIEVEGSRKQRLDRVIEWLHAEA